jgi:hypothetical protein
MDGRVRPGHDKVLATAPTGLFLYRIYISRRSTPPRIHTSAGINLPSELEAVMLDAIFLCAGLAFFAAAIGYTLICEKL